MIGKTISHYKILEKLGEGGMGVVYKAEDTKLKREVAIKFLPRRIDVSDEERQRFKLEAQAAAALNHNNIATVYEIDEIEGEEFIAMEIIKGESLKEKIATGPLKLDEAVRVATEVADGLHEAHEHKIIHRDIKPANIMLTAKGQCKIMDFGLAKMAQATLVTKEGTTLGTAAYMSPEQAQGVVVDHRADIWSLGVVLYEMLTGQLPFKGDYESAVLYSILHEDPDPVTGLRTGVPMELERIVLKCLEKAADERYQSATDLLVDLRKLGKGRDVSQSKSVVTAAAIGKEASGKSRRGLYALGAIGIAGLIALFVYLQKNTDPTSIRLTNPRKITQAIGQESWPTWSPDGSRIAYHANQLGNWDIWVKQLAGGEPINLTRQFDGDCWEPSWSPDGSQIAFELNQDRSTIWLVPAIGGTPRKIVTDFRRHSVSWSKDGRKLAYVTRDSVDSAEIYTLRTHEKHRIPLHGTQYEKTYLTWSPQGDTFAYVDAVVGNPRSAGTIWLVRITDGVAWPVTEGVYPSWSSDGRTLYFVSDRFGVNDLLKIKLDDEGRPDGQPMQLTFGLDMRKAAFSPDGAKLAYSKGEARSNLWRVPIPAAGDPLPNWEVAEQLTFEQALFDQVDISPDGHRLFFHSNRAGNSDLWSMPSTGGEFRQLTVDSTSESAGQLSPDGRSIAFIAHRNGKRDVWTMPVEGGAQKQITQNEYENWFPRWSPGGREIAYVSQQGGALSLWVIPAQGGEARQIPTGTEIVYRPLWWPDGKWLSFIWSRDGVSYNIWRTSLADGKRELVNRQEIRAGDLGVLRWSPDRTKIYFMLMLESRTNLWSLSVEDGSVHQLTDFKGRSGRMTRGLATDGKYFYFSWREETGDIWVMDVVKEN